MFYITNNERNWEKIPFTITSKDTKEYAYLRQRLVLKKYKMQMKEI